MPKILKVKILECGDYSACVQLNSSNESPKFAAWMSIYYLFDSIVRPSTLVIFSHVTRECITFKITEALKAGDTIILYTDKKIPDEVKQLVL